MNVAAVANDRLNSEGKIFNRDVLTCANIDKIGIAVVFHQKD